jgi:hypothetical protein
VDELVFVPPVVFVPLGVLVVFDPPVFGIPDGFDPVVGLLFVVLVLPNTFPISVPAPAPAIVLTIGLFKTLVIEFEFVLVGNVGVFGVAGVVIGLTGALGVVVIGLTGVLGVVVLGATGVLVLVTGFTGVVGAFVVLLVIGFVGVVTFDGGFATLTAGLTVGAGFDGVVIGATGVIAAGVLTPLTGRVTTGASVPALSTTAG